MKKTATPLQEKNCHTSEDNKENRNDAHSCLNSLANGQEPLLKIQKKGLAQQNIKERYPQTEVTHKENCQDDAKCDLSISVQEFSGNFMSATDRHSSRNFGDEVGNNL